MNCGYLGLGPELLLKLLNEELEALRTGALLLLSSSSNESRADEISGFIEAKVRLRRLGPYLNFTKAGRPL